MRIIVVGGGGREHAVVWKLAQSPLVSEIIVAPGNPGIAQHAECVPIGVMDFDGILALVRERTPDLVVIGPEDPLVAGLADVITNLGIPVAGPSRAAAQIEGSKSWTKQLMHEDGIPTSRSRSVSTIDDARTAIVDLAADGAVVIKADGLAAGKGVVIAESAAAAIPVAESFLSGIAFGAAGTTIVVEEFLTGTEVSLLCLTDGETIYPLLPACDYKRVCDGDIGPNTGGMGVYTPVPFVTLDLLDSIRTKILEPTLAGMEARGAKMRGVLYAGLIVTDSDVRVIEFNARFGDPETQVILPCLTSDLAALLYGVATGTLGSIAPPEFRGAAVGIALASGGYPGIYPKGLPITGLPDDLVSFDDSSLVFHAGTETRAPDHLVTAGGRVMTVVGTGDDLAEARSVAYDRVSRIDFDGMHFRTDIAARELG